jgi:RimJ/RimL family protein N-acetyltransferase
VGAAREASQVKVRRAREADAAALCEYMAALMGERLDTISAREIPTVADERDWILHANTVDRGMIVIAVAGEAVIGALDLWAGERPDNRHAGRFGMSVARPWRGRGVGRKLLTRAIEEARGWPGFCRIDLECVAWNRPAIALYESLGFRTEARMEKAINLRGRPETMLLMALTW